MVKFRMLQKLGLGGKTLWEAVSLGIPGAVWAWWCALSVREHAGFFQSDQGVGEVGACCEGLSHL